MSSNVAKFPSLIPTTASVIATISLSLNSNFSSLLASISDLVTISAKLSPSFITPVLMPLTTVPIFSC